MKKFRSPALGKVILLVCSVLFGLLGSECLVRWFHQPARRTFTRLHVPHETRLFDLRANATSHYQGEDFSLEFTTNSCGLKDFEIAPKTDDEFRVLCVGDSYTMGEGLSIEESFPKVLERLLRAEHPCSHISVINFGVGGYAPWQELSKLKDVGFELQPDLVVLQLYAENDVVDELDRIDRRARKKDKGYYRSLWMPDDSDMRRWLRRHSALFFLADKRWQALDFGIHVRPLRVRFMASDIKPLPARPWFFDTSLKEYNPELIEGWRLLEESVRGFRDECQRRGIPLYALPIPAYYELDITLVQRAFAPWGANVDLGQYDFSKNQRLVTAMLEKLALPAVDVYTPLVKSGDPSRYYWHHDGHLNAAGARLLAELLMPVVREEYRMWCEQRAISD